MPLVIDSHTLEGLDLNIRAAFRRSRVSFFGWASTCGACVGVRGGMHQVGISPTAEPNTQLRLPNTQHCLPNTQETVPNTQHFMPNTQNFEASHPKSCSKIPQNSEPSPDILGHAPSSLEPSGSKTRDRQSMGDWQFEETSAPQAPNFLKLSISSGLSVSMLLDPGIHSEVLAQCGNTFRGSPLLEGAHAGFALSGAKPPL